MRIDVLTLFPEMFQGVLGSSILKRAAQPVADAADPTKIRPPVVSYHLTNIRDYSADKHQKVDQSPYGGGPGMVIQCQPVWDAVRAVEGQEADCPPTRVLMTPQGMPLTQAKVEELSRKPRLLIIAGHYEGFDERVIEALEPIEQISIGDYVLSGGELAAMVLIDAVVRLLPGALGDDTSALHESFSPQMGGMLDYPHYTRPAEWMGRSVPPILLTGDHAKIEAWRREQARQRTAERRPDLLPPPPAPAPAPEVAPPPEVAEPPE
jgi:tRNA (guanine37-N1)-methyltransferase